MKNQILYSAEQIAFVKKHKQSHRMISFCRFLLLFSFLLLWEISTYLNWIDGFFFSSPSRVAACLLRLFLEENLVSHCLVTLFETMISFFLVTLLSLLLATALWASRKMASVVEPFLVMLNALPKSALAPLLIVWLGTNIRTIIVAGISVALFGSIINLYTGFKQTDEEKIKLIYTLHGTKADTFFKVVFPSSIPLLLSSMKVNIGLSLVGVIIGEFLSARIGLGYLIIYGSQVFQLDLVITSILILCGIALFLYLSVQGLEHHMKKQLT